MKSASETEENAFSGTLDADALPVALLKVDDAGRVRGFNAAWAEAMEAPPPGARIADYVHPEDRGVWQDMLARQQPGQPGAIAAVQERLRFVHPGGGLRWFEVSVRRVRGADDGYFVALSDITQARQRETSTQAHLRSALGLLDNIPGLIYRGRNNRLWTMEFVSAGCEVVTGYPRQWFLNSHVHTFGQLIVPEDADYVWCGVQQALARRAAFDLRYRIRCADGYLKKVWETGIGIYSASGEVLGVEGAIFEARAGHHQHGANGE